MGSDPVYTYPKSLFQSDDSFGYPILCSGQLLRGIFIFHDIFASRARIMTYSVLWLTDGAVELPAIDYSAVYSLVSHWPEMNSSRLLFLSAYAS